MRLERTQRNAVSRAGWLASRVSGVVMIAGVLAGNWPGRVSADAAVVIHVNPAVGDDASSVDGSSAQPFRTVTRALAEIADRVALQAAAGGAPGTFSAEVRLAGGNYGGSGEPPAGDQEGGEEVFPLRVPSGLARLAIVGPATRKLAPSAEGMPEGAAGAPGGDRAAVIHNDSADVPVFDLHCVSSPEGGGGTFELSLQWLGVSGGRNAATLLVEKGREIAVRVSECSFECQEGNALQLYVPAGAAAELSVEGCLVDGAGGGVAAETGDGAQLALDVRGCLLRKLRPYGPDGFLGAGVDVHLDPRAVVEARVERNVFHRMASALQLSAAQESPDPSATGGRMRVDFVGNLVVGSDPEPEVPGSSGGSVMRSALYLSLRPHHDIRFTAASNTFVRVGGPVLYHDNLGELRLMDASIPIEFVDNICRAVGADSEFDLELDGEEFPPQGVLIQGNLLEKSQLGREGIDGNLAGDPLFADEARGDFRIQADSPAVDRALPAYSELTDVDLDGRCRRTARTCREDLQRYPMDLGAFERPGLCDVDLQVFRRGDCNQSGGTVELTDPIYLFAYLFLGGKEPGCLDACDTNDDGALNITDGVYTLSYLFLGGEPPAPPFSEPGRDPSRDCLGGSR